MYVKLQSGAFEQAAPTPGQEPSDIPAKLEKRCILVYPGTFQSMDGEVEITDEKIQKLADNHNSTLQTLARMAEGAGLPMRACPPIQLDHSTAATHTVGRLVGNLEVADHKLEDGSTVKGLFGTAHILGKENVEKVLDGRWTNLSIGADLETGKLSELTITPFPAAPGAALLSKKRLGTIYKIKGGEEVNVYSRGGKHYVDADKYQEIFSTKSELDKWLKDNKAEWAGEDNSEDEMSKLASPNWTEKHTDEQEIADLALSLEADDAFKNVKKTESDGKFTVSADFNLTTDGKKLSSLGEDRVSVQTYKGHEITVEKADESTWHVSIDGESLPGGKPQKTSAAAVYVAKKFIDESQLGAQPAPIKDGDPMKTGFKKHLAEVEKMSDEDAEKKHEAMKKHLMEDKKLSEEDADKHLAEATDEDCAKMASELDEKEKKLAAEKEEEEKLAAEKDEEEKKLAEEAPEVAKAKMSAVKAKLSKLSAALIKGRESVQLSQRKASIKVRLAGLRKEAKITPAELKKLDISALALKGDEAVQVALSTFAKREPQVLVGLYGSANATEIAKLAGERQEEIKKAKLEIEMRTNMGKPIPASLKRLAGEPVAAEEGEKETETNIHIDTSPHTDVMSDDDWSEMKKLITEGKDDDAKKVMSRHMSTVMKKLGSVEGTDAEADLTSVAEEIKQMSAQVEEAVKLASELAE